MAKIAQDFIGCLPLELAPMTGQSNIETECNGNVACHHGGEEIKRHPFFARHVDWNRYANTFTCAELF